jgi:hypothetical protein
MAYAWSPKDENCKLVQADTLIENLFTSSDDLKAFRGWITLDGMAQLVALRRADGEDVAHGASSVEKSLSIVLKAFLKVGQEHTYPHWNRNVRQKLEQ